MVIGGKFELLSFNTSITLAQEAKYESSSFIGIPAELEIPSRGQLGWVFPTRWVGICNCTVFDFISFLSFDNFMYSWALGQALLVRFKFLLDYSCTCIFLFHIYIRTSTDGCCFIFLPFKLSLILKVQDFWIVLEDNKILIVWELDGTCCRYCYKNWFMLIWKGPWKVFVNGFVCFIKCRLGEFVRDKGRTLSLTTVGVRHGALWGGGTWAMGHVDYEICDMWATSHMGEKYIYIHGLKTIWVELVLLGYVPSRGDLHLFTYVINILRFYWFGNC